MKNIILHILIVLLVAGCGFQLRGKTNLPQDLHTLYLQSVNPYSAFTRDLRTRLQYADVNILDSAKHAPVTLDILGEAVTAPQTTIGSSQQMREYNVTYSINYAIKDDTGHTLVGPRTVSTNQNIILQANELLNDSYKLVSAKQTMRAQLIDQMMFQLASESTAKALQKPLHETKH